jgi:uncharacterized protein (TIGR02588 family)
VTRGSVEERTQSSSDPHRSRVEWGTLLVSATLLLALVAILTHAHLTTGDSTPIVDARPDVGALRRVEGSYHLPVVVRNRGRAAARHVQIRVSLPQSTGAAENADLRLDVLPAGATETATVVLRADPSRAPLEARVLSYLTG